MNRVETLKTHLPFSGEEGLQELKNIAVRFEEYVYRVATGQVYMWHTIFPWSSMMSMLNSYVSFEVYFNFSALQSDYLRKISLKMLAVEGKSLNPMVNCALSTAASSSRNPPNPGKISLFVFNHLIIPLTYIWWVICVALLRNSELVYLVLLSFYFVWNLL